jgi:hypothetical protein
MVVFELFHWFMLVLCLQFFKKNMSDLKVIDGLQARLPFRWSWKEDWEISTFPMPIMPI